MEKPTLIISEEKNTTPLLIIDKQGLLGNALAESLTKEFLTVLVSGRPLPSQGNGRIIHIPFVKRMPSIPDNKFSHIIFICHGSKEEFALLPHLVQKTKRLGARFIFAGSIYKVTEQFVKSIASHARDVDVLVYGDIFADNLPFENTLTELLVLAKTKGSITLVNSGMQHVYPIHLDDVVASLLKIAFTQKQATLPTIYNASLKHPVTYFSVARMLKKHNPLLKIDFLKRQTDSSHHVFRQGFYLFSHYPLEQRLADVVFDPHVTVRQRKKAKRFMQLPFAPLLAGILLAVAIISLPFLLFAGMAFYGYTQLLSAKDALEGGNLQIASQKASQSVKALAVTERVSENLVRMTPAIGFRTQLFDFARNVHTGREVAESTLGITQALITLQKMYGEEGSASREEVIRSLNTLKNENITLQKILAENRLPPQYSEKLKMYERPLQVFGLLADVLPHMLGFHGKQTYLLLFQNNMELRPGGGFIGSYGITDIDKGKMGKFTVHDVYDADGQLKGHIEPPFALRRYLGSSHLYLRDSNFTLDFPKNASTAAYLLGLETGQKVNAVVGIDITFIKEVIRAVEPLYIPDYNETITADTFFEKTESHVQDKFFAGSTQKKDFLRAVYAALEARLTQRKGVSYGVLLKAFADGLYEKHILFAFSNSSIQRVFSINNFSSSLKDERKKDVFLDFAGVNEANLGENKANFFLTRSLGQSVRINEGGEVLSVIRVQYENTSSKENKFGGDYKAFIRFIVPEGASLQRILIDGEEQEVVPAITNVSVYLGKRFIPPLGLEVETVQEDGKTMYGFLTIVPSRSKKMVQIQYAQKQVFPVNEAASAYDLLVYKQPGTEKDQYTFTLQYPEQLTLLHVNTDMAKQENAIQYTGTLAEDRRIILQFARK
ncbi:MAG: DUF4012 domain-containing protein [Candidatus Levybacteria bacterium]|nr:DUF4012 domain-containing protein [Candidatus Levybacteria bacterium]